MSEEDAFLRIWSQFQVMQEVADRRREKGTIITNQF